jgi:hypothetical protein
LQGLTKAIDNGGRFSNLISHGGDSGVSRGELARSAGVFCSGRSAFLFLEMAQHELSPQDRAEVEQTLERDLRAEYRRRRPTCMAP